MSTFKRTLVASLSISVLGLVAYAVVAGNKAVTGPRDPLSFGLIHRWTLDGNASDSVGKMNTTPIGPVSYAEVGGALGMVFDGETTGISFPTQPDMQFEGSFSISVWANLFARPSGGKLWSDIIFNGDDRPGLDPYALQADHNGKIQFLLTGANGSGSGIDAPMPLNTFVYLTATYEKATGTQSFYEDGKLVNQITGNTTLTPVVPLVGDAKPGIGIGTNNSFPNSSYHYGWKGIIADLRIYNRALAPAEALALYHQGVTRTATTKITPVINPTR
jgi:hypothetical protein